MEGDAEKMDCIHFFVIYIQIYIKIKRKNHAL